MTIQAQILDLIKLLQNDIGMSVMFITHDMGVVAEVADRVVVMLKGKKVEEGPAEQVFHDPQHPYTKALLSAVPRLGSMTGMKNPAKYANVDVNRSEGEAVTTLAGKSSSKSKAPSGQRAAAADGGRADHAPGYPERLVRPDDRACPHDGGDPPPPAGWRRGACGEAYSVDDRTVDHQTVDRPR